MRYNSEILSSLVLYIHPVLFIQFYGHQFNVRCAAVMRVIVVLWSKVVQNVGRDRKEHQQIMRQSLRELLTCRNNYELSNRISYCVCTFDDVSYVVCRVEVATPPVQVPLTQEHQKDESTPCLTVRDRSSLSTVSMNVVSHVASLITLNLTPAELRL